ncbi:SurA N-terminal domain-containing protein [Pseudoxanthobacter sp. M-2]|uniref:peptidylprolyl isomerase n=1 Tax=Pseudoxanthobacter sp. M-2 TaxID=3078754 RepID=UPI0038FCA8C8
MLDQMRRGAQTWVAKILIGILVASFAVWGVSGFLGGGATNIIVTVGDTEIPTARFQQDYARAIQGYTRQIGRALSPTEAAQLGVPQQVLGRLITEATMSEVANGLGLGLSDAELARQIKTDPSFQGAAGNFDRERMRMLLQQSDLTEAQYVEAMFGLAERRQIADGLIGGLETPNTYLEAVNRYQNEERTVRYLTLPPSAAPAPGEPTDEALATYFEANKAQFRAPEYRTFAVMLADPQTIADPASVSDDEARAAYDRASGRFGTPEKRRVDQIVFPDRAAADAAVAALATGTAIDAILAERGLKPGDADLGLVAKTDLIDAAVADAAFAMAAGETRVVDGRFGPVLLRVTEIAPSARQPFDEVKDTLKQEIAAERATADVASLYDEVEDARAGGSTLAEIGERFKIPLQTVQAVDATGATADGTKPAVPGGTAVLTGAFDADPGTEPDPVQVDRRGFAWFEVSDVIPARDRTLDEVRDPVVAAWREAETALALDKLATDVAERIRGGESIDAAATTLNATVATSAPFKRGGTVDGLTPQAVAAAFSGGTGTVATAPAQDGGRTVLVVDQITEPAFFAETPEMSELGGELSRAIGNSLLTDYVTEMERTLGVAVNQQAFSAVVGLDRDTGS